MAPPVHKLDRYCASLAIDKLDVQESIQLLQRIAATDQERVQGAAMVALNRWGKLQHYYTYQSSKYLKTAILRTLLVAVSKLKEPQKIKLQIFK